MPRALQLLPVPTGDRILDLLPRLRAALSGSGPVLLPAPANDIDNISITRLLGPAAELDDGEDDDHDPTAVVVVTSGSTGPPKGALLTVSALAASADATRQRLSLLRPTGRGSPAPKVNRPPDQWLLTLSATHIAGLQVVLRALAAGTEPTILDTAEPFTADRFCAAVERVPAGPRFTSLVPTQLVRLLADPEATHALTTFDAVLVGGAAAPSAVLQRAAEAGATVVTTYGMTETCGGCIYDGLPLDGVTVTLAAGEAPTSPAEVASHQDDPAKTVTPGASEHRGKGQGRVVISGSVIARGYRGIPGHPAFTRHAGRRSFRTQDIGRWDGDRTRIIGRTDDVLVTGGVKVDPAAVESVLAAVPGVRDVILTGVPDPEWSQRLVAVLVPVGPGVPGLDELRAAATRVHGAPAAPRQLLVVDEIPHRGIGKPDRAAVRRLAIQALASGFPAVEPLAAEPPSGAELSFEQPAVAPPATEPSDEH